MASSSRSAVLKREIEAKLAARIPAALSPLAQQAPKLMACGIPSIDALLGGGFPIGGISELTGGPSSGRTSLALSLLAEATRESTCAWVDGNDTFDPRSAAASLVCIRNLLWVRLTTSGRPAGSARLTSPPALGITPEGGKLAGQRTGWLHPRTETRGVDRALEAMLARKVEARLDKMEGTPGYANRKLGLAAAPDEQVQYEHFNARRADASDPIRQADRRAAAEARQRAEAPALLLAPTRNQAKTWTRLEQAIKATDQILQSGGFRVVVLDLASTAPEQAVRIPSATWFRFRRAAQESDAILLLLTQVACARSSALCVLDCAADTMSGPGNESGAVLSRLSQSVEVARQRQSSPFAKKAPSRAVSWEARPTWMRAAGI